MTRLANSHSIRKMWRWLLHEAGGYRFMGDRDWQNRPPQTRYVGPSPRFGAWAWMAGFGWNCSS